MPVTFALRTTEIFEEDNANLEPVIERADRALYKDKGKEIALTDA